MTFWHMIISKEFCGILKHFHVWLRVNRVELKSVIFEIRQLSDDISVFPEGSCWEKRTCWADENVSQRKRELPMISLWMFNSHVEMVKHSSEPEEYESKCDSIAWGCAAAVPGISLPLYQDNFINFSLMNISLFTICRLCAVSQISLIPLSDVNLTW